MRLLVVGRLNGQVATAVKMAMATGAKVAHVETSRPRAPTRCASGQGADLLMVDYDLDIAGADRRQRGRADPRAGGGLRRRRRPEQAPRRHPRRGQGVHPAAARRRADRRGAGRRVRRRPAR